MAKTKEDLTKSREFRAEVIDKYGDVPTSVWKMSYADNHLVLDTRVKQYEVSYTNPDMSKDMQGAFETSGRSVRGKGAGQSMQPYDNVERILKFYSEPGDTVLDPTMGVATAITVTNHLNRNFIGYDVSKEHFAINEKVRDHLQGKTGQGVLFDNECTIELHNQSSENMTQVPDNSVDCVFFSPPYWDTEYYGDEPDQLGYKKTYPQFLQGLGRIVSECYRALKPGKFCVMNINDFRKDGKFYDFHGDTINLMNQAGFERWDTIIMVWPSCIGAAFASQVEGRKKTAKAHEYLIVGRKPL